MPATCGEASTRPRPEGAAICRIARCQTVEYVGRAHQGAEGEGPMEAKETSKISVAQFLARKEAPEIHALIGKFNGGAFMTCHTAVFAQTGIWIEELVPVFQRLDAHLAVTVDRQT